MLALSYRTLREPARTTLVLRGPEAPGQEQLDELEADLAATVGVEVEVVARFAPILSLPVPEPLAAPTEEIVEVVERAVERRGVTVITIDADASTGLVSMVVTDEAAESTLEAAANAAAPDWTFDIVRVAIATTTTNPPDVDEP